MNITIQSDNPLIRLADKKLLIKSAALYKAEPDGHKFKPGQILTLHGLFDLPEFNGEQVEITAIRKDGQHGKAYYIKGAINEFVNWVYEYRLK